MASTKIIGVLQDRRGNIIPNTKVWAKCADSLANNPDDQASSITDAYGNYQISTLNAATEYNLWVIEISEVDSSNYIGRAFSSGVSVGTYNLSGDADWNLEHYGLSGVSGKHKDTTHDSILLNTSGYFKSTDSVFNFRIGSDTALLNIEDIGDTFFFRPKPSGGSNTHLGLMEGAGSEVANFYFGTAAVPDNFYINTSGEFNLGAGSFEGAVTFESTALFKGIASFEVSEDPAVDYPQITYIDSALPYKPPTAINHLVPKKYVDDEIQDIDRDKIYEGYSSVEVIDTGTGQVKITLDGNIYANFVSGKFCFGGNYTPLDLVHLRQANTVAVRVENTASAETSRLTENSVGTPGSQDFFFLMNGAEAGRMNNAGNWGFGVPAAINEKVHVNGNIQLKNYLHIDTKYADESSVPDPPLEEARIYLKRRNAKNNELCCKLKKKVGGVGTMTEVLLTSPEAKCCVCGAEGSARDPYFDTVNGKMVVEFFCGHTFEMDVNYKLRT